MPTTPPVNTQQVLQMGTHTEKLQHTMQTQPTVVSQQVDKERQLADELKRRQVQDMDPAHFLEETDPHTKAKKRVRVRKKNRSNTDDDILEPHRGKINIVV